MIAISRRHLIASTALSALAAPHAWPQTQQAVQAPAGPQRAAPSTSFARFTGDFDQMLERRFIRLVVPYSRVKGLPRNLLQAASWKPSILLVSC
jgi:hypothetical protein